MIFNFNHFSFRKRYDDQHCHNKPQTGNGARVWMTSCPEEMGWEFWKILKKIQLKFDHGVEKLRSDHAIEDLRLDHAGRQLSFCHWDRELSSLPLSWVFYRCGGGRVFRVPTSEDELRSKTSWDVPNVGGVFSIVWLRKTFKNCVSLLVSNKRRQKLINRS